ncbi:LGFP repeat-containing protein, partial [Streptomyces europaeiscabiei]|uniref:LGFP repeat-containing protein n=1 Tax=Streptomyces europaeiscabiei TaxID=146819 RepID=UPI0038F7AD46
VYESMGGRGGVLGAATSDYLTISASTGSGTGRAYDGGSIYWTQRTGAAAVIEPFRSFYFGYGGATGILGWPNSQSAPIPGKAGAAGQSFTEGSV